MNSESQQYVSARRRSQWRTAVTPAGQGEKLPSAVFALEAGWLLRRTSALHIAASRLAVPTNISIMGY